MHVAIIMDGNRRWAARMGLPAHEGHRAGVAALREAVRGALDADAAALTVFGFSTENWRRDAGEVQALMQLCAAFARDERSSLLQSGVRVRVIGEYEAFAFPARAALKALVRATAHNRRLTLHLALNYSGRAELVRAAAAIARDAASGALSPADVNEQALRVRLYEPDAPDPDLLIRTGGESRISNFLLYQLAYTEIVSLPIMWPEFTAAHFAAAVSDYAQRERRFGS
jgi:undecaprenyl diphosphate synthase